MGIFGRGPQADPLGSTSGASRGAGLTAAPAPPREPSDTPIVLAFALLATLAVGIVLWQDVRADERDPVQKAQRGEVTVGSDLSLVSAPRLRRAVAVAAAHVPAHSVLTSLRVDPTRVVATLRAPSGDRSIVNVDVGLGATTSGFGAGDDRGLAPAAIDVDAPARFLAAVGERAGVPPTALDYLVLNVSSIDGHASWVLFLRPVVQFRQRQWQADAHGGDVRRLGEPDAAARRQTAQAAAEARRRLAEGARRSACLQRARSAPAALRCTR